MNKGDINHSMMSRKGMMPVPGVINRCDINRRIVISKGAVSSRYDVSPSCDVIRRGNIPECF